MNCVQLAHLECNYRKGATVPRGNPKTEAENVTPSPEPIFTPAEKFEAQGVKRCTHCGAEKRLTEFYRHPERSDGLQSWCKTCTKAAALARHYAHYVPKPYVVVRFACKTCGKVVEAKSHERRRYCSPACRDRRHREAKKEST